MSTVILVVCLIASPVQCHDERVPIEGISCITQAQMQAAQWLEEHPKYTVRGWKCQFGPRGEDA
jgi:hypothetical protein